MAKPATGAVRRRGRKVDDNEPADEPSSRGNSKNAASGASAPGASKGKKRDAAPKKPAKDGGRVVSRTKRQSAKARVDLVKRLAAFVCVACLAVYLRAIPMGAIPEAFQDRVEHAMPHWLNSSMHLLNGLPALNTTAFNGNGRRGSPSPGAQARAAGRKPHHPVVIVPGFISSGLELWEGHDCGRHFFRQRMWGTPAMARAYFADRACWMQHMRLDPKTGLDPSGIKLRAVTGLEAVDWFVPGYFVWGKVIESLGDVGYDPNSIHAATFDWRLSPEQLERRDGYFTRLKHSVETLVEIHGVPVALLAHSYGDQLVRYFLNWVETTKAEGRGARLDVQTRRRVRGHRRAHAGHPEDHPEPAERGDARHRDFRAARVRAWPRAEPAGGLGRGDARHGGDDVPHLGLAVGDAPARGGGHLGRGRRAGRAGRRDARAGRDERG
jgi:phospholipid:diacylglycerol acyltransferase